MRISFVLATLGLLTGAYTQDQNPFAPPTAKVHYAPDRTFDLKHVKVVLDVDYRQKRYSGTSINTLAPLRDGITSIVLHASAHLTLTGVTVGGQKAAFKQTGEDVTISFRGKKGLDAQVALTYHSREEKAGGLMSYGGWHWILPTDLEPNRVGFWTQGETHENRIWAPTWDYPNDFATSETVTTVPAGWTVVGNGVLLGEKPAPNGKTTFHWKMSQPHATYLISLVAGPYDIKKDKWRDVDLWYVVPKGKGHLIDDSFGDTKDMLDFFSDTLGVKYAWPKYAQNAVYEFGGGMENVSSTTLGQESLTDRRQGFRHMSGLNSHELGHQWFGDLVTCRDWGHIWLNESFATYLQKIYFEHSQGKAQYDREIEDANSGYFSEAKRYRRPLATNLYADPNVVFDSHAYPKGASVLHMLRRKLGDSAFYAGLKRYLTVHRHQPATSSDLCQAITEATGVNVEPFFDQWVYKPGHPVLKYGWEQDGGNLHVKVSQVQDTSNGTPIYDLDLEIGVIWRGKMVKSTHRLKDKEATFVIPVSAQAVLLDPDHDLLREIDHAFAPSELEPIARFATNAVVRARALTELVATQSAESVKVAVELLTADAGLHGVFPPIPALANVRSDDVRKLARKDLSHPNIQRRAWAVGALAAQGLQGEDENLLVALIRKDEAFPVVVAALNALDPKKHAALFMKAAEFDCFDGQVQNAALTRWVGTGDRAARDLAMRWGQVNDPIRFNAALAAMHLLEPAEDTRKVLRRALKMNAWGSAAIAVEVVAAKKDASLKDALRELSSRTGAPDWLKNRIADVLKQLP